MFLVVASKLQHGSCSPDSSSRWLDEAAVRFVSVAVKELKLK